MRTDEDGELALAKEPEPPRVDHLAQASKEGTTLRRDLHVEAVVAHEHDVLEPVVGGDGHLGPARDQVDRARHAKVCRGREGVS